MKIIQHSILILLLPLIFGCATFQEIFIAKKGTLVAAPGMSFEQVRKASTLELPKEYRMADETTLTNSEIVDFEFKLGGTDFAVPGCKFYSLWEKHASPGLYHVQIQVDKDLTWARAKQRLQEIERQLKGQGWIPMLLEGKSAEQRLSEAAAGGAPRYSVGFTWFKNDIALIFTARRSPYAVNQEDPNEGAHYEIELDIRPKDHR